MRTKLSDKSMRKRNNEPANLNEFLKTLSELFNRNSQPIIYEIFREFDRIAFETHSSNIALSKHFLQLRQLYSIARRQEYFSHKSVIDELTSIPEPKQNSTAEPLIGENNVLNQKPIQQSDAYIAKPLIFSQTLEVETTLPSIDNSPNRGQKPVDDAYKNTKNHIDTDVFLSYQTINQHTINRTDLKTHSNEKIKTLSTRTHSISKIEDDLTPNHNDKNWQVVRIPIEIQLSDEDNCSNGFKRRFKFHSLKKRFFMFQTSKSTLTIGILLTMLIIICNYVEGLRTSCSRKDAAIEELIAFGFNQSRNLM